MEPTDRILATLPEVLEVVCAAMEKASAKEMILAVDTETNGLRFWKDLCIGISFAWNKKEGFYVPFFTWEGGPDGCFRSCWSDQTLPENALGAQANYPKKVVRILRDFFTHDSVRLIMHNAPFDVLVLERALAVDLSAKVMCDTALLKHVVDENTPASLKETALLWQEAMGLPADRLANQEQIEMGASVTKNGGKFNKSNKHVWRGDLDVVGRYACADARLTVGIFREGTKRFIADMGPERLAWFYEDEVMPVCREVVIPMKRRGINIDVSLFRRMEVETRKKLEDLEDRFQSETADLIRDFDRGSSMNEMVSKQFLAKTLMRMEALPHPTLKDGKESLSKAAVTAARKTAPHWVWDWILGEGEIRLSDSEMERVRREIYRERTGKRYHFNVSSDAHLRWLFCEKLGHDPRDFPQTDSATEEKPIPQMAAKVLKEMVGHLYPWVKTILLHKKLSKLHGTYILPALALQDEGILRMDMKQNGTLSGRFSCGGGFNLQTLPQVEELTNCPKCGSKKVVVEHPMELLATLRCEDCSHVEEEILCPSAIKKGFIAPTGFSIVNADFSSLEPRCFAWVSGDTKLKEIFWKDLDMYSKIYCDMYDLTGEYSSDPKAENFLKKKNKKARDLAKVFCLAIPYGAQSYQVARLTKSFKKNDDGEEIPDVEQGQKIIDDYLTAYPHLARYMKNQNRKAATDGYVDTRFGRRRRFQFVPKVAALMEAHDLTIDDFRDMRRSSLDKVSAGKVLTKKALHAILQENGINPFDAKTGAPRTWALVKGLVENELNNAKNFPIQGLAAHITNRSMLEVARMLKEQDVEGQVILNVHDEVTLMVREDQAEVAASILRQGMEKNIYAVQLDVQMVADPIIAKSLKEAK